MAALFAEFMNGRGDFPPLEDMRVGTVRDTLARSSYDWNNKKCYVFRKGREGGRSLMETSTCGCFHGPKFTACAGHLAHDHGELSSRQKSGLASLG